MIQCLLAQTLLNRHTDVDLTSGDEVYDDTKPVQGGEYACKETVRNTLSVGVDVEDDDTFLDGHGSG